MVHVIVTEASNSVPAYDLSNFDPAAVDVIDATASSLVLDFDGFTITFQGTFAYSAGQVTAGSTATAFTMRYDGTTVLSATGLNLAYNDLASQNLESLLQQQLSGDDTFTSAWNGGEYIMTYDGDDTIRSGTGNDIIDGGSGQDTYVTSDPYGRWGFSFHYLEGVVIHGANQEDRLLNIETVEIWGTEVLVQEGGAGNDRLTSRLSDGGTGDEAIHGRYGNDTISGGVGNDFLIGGAGTDKVSGGGGRDLIEGGAGNDGLRGQSGHDQIYGDAGRDTLKGGTGHDTLKGGDDTDKLEGNDGKDKLSGGKGNDMLDGGEHNDRLLGDGGNDQLRGGNGNDILRGGHGKDMLAGGTGDDQLYGNNGKDKLLGHKGNDQLTGGKHADVFVFHKGHGNDTITDFTVGVDHIEIGRGASRLKQLEFSQQGDDVLIAFADVTILVEDTTVTQMQDADNFLF